MSTSAQEAKAKLLNKQYKQGSIKFKTRAFNRCMMTGRKRGYIRQFGICRHMFRELALKGLLPGVKKASW
ncbi:30S ribosomal protein S14 [Candidatus Dojkabacteria bacterium]|nr:30S ribosomal protein S14 [Candidatus Dojkabacteria bacterium]